MEGICVTIRTSSNPVSGSYSNLWISLIGSQSKSSPFKVSSDGGGLLAGSVYTIMIQPDENLGQVVLVRLRLEAQPGFPDLPWHCKDVQVKLSANAIEVECFPCHKWINSSDGDVVLRSDKVYLLHWESMQILKDHRAKELENTKQHIRWKTFFEGTFPGIDLTRLQDLGQNLSFTRHSPNINLQYLKGFTERAESWKSLGELEMLFLYNGQDNVTAKYVHTHWRDDSFFGHQCLNGSNPLLIRRIHSIPPNLAVTSKMLNGFLPLGSSLEQELKKGTMFLLNYEILDQLPANVINGKQSYLAAPLCLLHYNQHGELKPIAIQLQKTPDALNPVFLPSDPAHEWLLAKMWVRNADFQVHQLISHFMCTHLIGEVCCIATLRNLPEVHPLHQLLMPHIRYTLQINTQARGSILAPNGVFDKAVGCGMKAAPILLARGSQQLHYSSLCVPDDLKERGLDSLPNCYYAQDALKVWNALHRFVANWVDLYYPDDQEVQHDTELQSWIKEIHVEGFLGLTHTGFPQSFQTKLELKKFTTMIIFTCSALHAALNFSQMDFALWMPNCPPAMCRPPPQAKGLVKEEDILSYLPDVNSTCNVLLVLSMLSQPAVDFVPLCQYRDWYFKRGDAHKLVEKVQKELGVIAKEIKKRNSSLKLPYSYLCPDYIENGVAI